LYYRKFIEQIPPACYFPNKAHRFPEELFKGRLKKNGLDKS
jgi:hypothetical protein